MAESHLSLPLLLKHCLPISRLMLQLSLAQMQSLKSGNRSTKNWVVLLHLIDSVQLLPGMAQSETQLGLMLP